MRPSLAQGAEAQPNAGLAPYHAAAERYTGLFHHALGTVGLWQKRHHQAQSRIVELEDALRVIAETEGLLPALMVNIARAALAPDERNHR